jgi:hypothetical protein
VAISGGSMRFVFQLGSPLAVRRRQSDGKSCRVRAAPLSATLRDPRFLIFFAVWVGLNALFGLGTLRIAGEGQEIAWQAHIGGFVAGLLLFNAFDPAMPRSEFNGWRSCTTHTRLDAAAQQAQADEERAIKKCPQVELGADKSVTLTRLSTRSVGAGRHSR